MELFLNKRRDVIPGLYSSNSKQEEKVITAIEKRADDICNELIRVKNDLEKCNKESERKQEELMRKILNSGK